MNLWMCSFSCLLQHSILSSWSTGVLSHNRRSLLFLEVVSDPLLSLDSLTPDPLFHLHVTFPLTSAAPPDSGYALRNHPSHLDMVLFPSLTFPPWAISLTAVASVTLKVTPKPVSGFQLLFGHHYNAPSFLSGFPSHSAWNLVFPLVLWTEYLFFPNLKVEALTLNVMVFGDGGL